MSFLYKLIKSKRSLHTHINTWVLRHIFLHIGKNTKIDPSLWYDHPDKIHISDDCEIRRGVIMIGRSDNEVGIFLDKGVHIHQYAYLDAYGGEIRLGEGVRIGHHSIIAGHGGVTFGKYSGVAGLSYVIAADHNFKDSNIPHVLQKETRKGIVIGENVWGASGVIILDGITIGNNCVIGAGAVVRRDVPNNSVVIGNPGRVAYRF
jgi:acetyltransferase-like isoleucine patch superfamily enzyme